MFVNLSDLTVFRLGECRTPMIALGHRKKGQIEMARRKLVQSKCQTCGTTIHDRYRPLTECYSCGVARWERFDGIQRAPDHLTVVGK